MSCFVLARRTLAAAFTSPRGVWSCSNRCVNTAYEQWQCDCISKTHHRKTAALCAQAQLQLYADALLRTSSIYSPISYSVCLLYGTYGLLADVYFSSHPCGSALSSLAVVAILPLSATAAPLLVAAAATAASFVANCRTDWPEQLHAKQALQMLQLRARIS
eukprot:15897-Heterococcus_DN1.PRE.1